MTYFCLNCNHQIEGIIERFNNNVFCSKECIDKFYLAKPKNKTDRKTRRKEELCIHCKFFTTYCTKGNKSTYNATGWCRRYKKRDV